MMAGATDASTTPPAGYLGSQGFPRRHWLVGPDARFVACCIPKCACSTLKRWVCASLGDERGSRMGGAIHRYCRMRYSLDLRPPDEQHRILASALRFAVVRDPLLRLASAFASKFVARGPLEFASKPVVEFIQLGAYPRYDAKAPVRSAHSERNLPISTRVDYARGVSFREFIAFLCQTPSEHLNAHWRPQADFLESFDPHLLLPAEDLHASLARVVRELSLTTPPPPPRPQHARQPGLGSCLADIPSGELRRRGIVPTASDLLDEEICGQIRDRYAPDFALHTRAEKPDKEPQI